MNRNSCLLQLLVLALTLTAVLATSCSFVRQAAGEGVGEQMSKALPEEDRAQFNELWKDDPGKAAAFAAEKIGPEKMAALLHATEEETAELKAAVSERNWVLVGSIMLHLVGGLASMSKIKKYASLASTVIRGVQSFLKSGETSPVASLRHIGTAADVAGNKLALKKMVSGVVGEKDVIHT